MKKADPEIEAQLHDVAGYAPPVDTDTLLALPEDSLGYAYARFLSDNGLDHFNLNSKLLERFKDNTYAIRYTVTHDLHHVLTGFDAGAAGEQGVVGFTAGQGIAPAGTVGLWVGRIVAALVSPSQASQTLHNYKLGVRMGKAAKLLIAAPLESWFPRPLEEVRAELGIEQADIAQVQASGTSWVGKVLYKDRASKALPEAEAQAS